MPAGPPPTVRLAELIGSLSPATDMAAGLPLETALRTCLLATELGKDLRLSKPVLSDVYYSALLRFLGCTACAPETAALMDGDDHAALRALSTLDTARPGSRVAFATKELGRGRPTIERAGIALRFLLDTKGFERLARAQVDLAVHLARQLGLGHSVAQSLSQMFERYDGKGAPDRVRSDQLHPPARILQVAARAEIHRALLGPDAAIDAVRKRRGGELDPEVADIFLQRAPEHLQRLGAASVWAEFLAAEPEPRRLVPKTHAGTVAETFARYVDLKSSYTLTHSTGIAQLVTLMAQRGRRSMEETENLRIAALLHDLGRVAIPNGIWDKPGSLSVIETERMYQHALQTERILGSSPYFGAAARIAGLHHERLDGSGYSRRASAASLPWSARVLAAADTYHAMTEERPYRAALTPPEAAEQLRQAARAGKFDPGVVESLLNVVAMRPKGRREWPADLGEADVEVLRLLARGLSSEAMSARLSLPTREIQQHLRNIQARTDITTRPAAALFAVEQGLMDTQ